MQLFLISLFVMLRSLFRPVAFGVAGAIFDSDGRVLLVRQTYMTGWRLPGGAIGLGEGPETALRRELHEELGLTGGRVRLFGIYSRKLWWLTHVVALYVIEGGEIDFHPNLEISAIRWDAPQAPAPGAAPATARRLAELAAGAQQGDRWRTLPLTRPARNRKPCSKTAMTGRSGRSAPKTRRGSPC